MSSSERADRKADYFGTFLDVLSRGVTEVGGAPQPEKIDLPDCVIQMLALRGGTASISDLLTPPFNAVGPLLGAIQELRTFGLAETNGPVVQLTAAGEVVAKKLDSLRPAGEGAAIHGRRA